MVRLPTLLKIGLLSSLATVLMFYQIPMFATFLKYDLSEVPALVGTFALGPAAGAAIVILKNMLFTVARFSPEELVGIPLNTLAGLTLVLTCGSLYRLRKTKAWAVFSLVAGVLTMTLVMIPANFILYPLFAHVFLGVDLTGGQLLGTILTTITAFNLVKGSLTSVVTFLVYKRFSHVLKTEPLWEVTQELPSKSPIHTTR